MPTCRGLREKLANDPDMLHSPNLVEMIVEDQKISQKGFSEWEL